MIARTGRCGAGLVTPDRSPVLVAAECQPHWAVRSALTGVGELREEVAEDGVAPEMSVKTMVGVVPFAFRDSQSCVEIANVDDAPRFVIVAAFEDDPARP